MLLPLLLIVASVAGTETFDYQDPSFWRKSYEIPLSYCTSSLVLETNDPKARPPFLSGCEFDAPDPSNGDSYAFCRSSKHDVEAFLAQIRGLGSERMFLRACEPAPRIPELDYKLQNLEREARAISLSSTTLPGISGLMDAQLSTLRMLIGAQERASHPAVSLLLTGRAPENPTDASALMDRRLRSSRAYNAEENARFDNFHPWRRAPYPACDQLPKIHIRFLVSDANDEERLRRAARRLGKPYAEPLCFARRGRQGVAVISGRSKRDIQSALFRIPGIESFSVVGQLRHAKAVLDDRRLKILTEELDRGDSLLRQAPHIRALVLSEIDSVRPRAALMDEIRRGTLIVIDWKPPELKAP